MYDYNKIREEYGPVVTLDLQARKEREREKALQKYGAAALAPGGRPEFDILDFLLNEVVGLDRYGEMVENRFAHTKGTDFDICALGEALREISAMLAPAFSQVRHQLMDKGWYLGVNEVSRFVVAEQGREVPLG